LTAKARRRKGAAAEAISRLDRWLWITRLVKSRSLAARLITAGAVALNGRSVKKPAHPIRIGDEIALKDGPYRRSLRVLGLGVRRGPAAEARALYEEAAEPRPLSNLPTDRIPLRAQSESAASLFRRPGAETGTTGFFEDERSRFEPRSPAPDPAQAPSGGSLPRPVALGENGSSQRAPCVGGDAGTSPVHNPTSARRAPRTRSAAKYSWATARAARLSPS
jgi:ribosome-associated heat shock protein Hsp15